MSSLAHCSAEHLASVFAERQVEIIDQWRMDADKMLGDLKLDKLTLTDHMPGIVAEIVRDLAWNREGPLSEEHIRGSPPVHGVQRFYDGLDVSEVVGEYNLLRAAFTSVAAKQGFYVVGAASQIINHRIDEAVRMAVQSFASEQAQMRKAQHDEHLAFVAHDLRTPLNAVSLLVQELKYCLDEKTIAAAGDLFDVLARNIQRLEALIQRVLDGRAQPQEAGTSFKPELRTFELWPLVQRLIKDMSPIASKSGIVIFNQIPSNLTICADAGLISQVYQNLLGNAFKYAANGKVFITARLDDQNVECAVRDDGSGIPAQMLGKVFDKLVTDPEKDGKGLGLAIVQQIVEAHGGSVAVESTLGAGATFTFTLPASKPV